MSIDRKGIGRVVYAAFLILLWPAAGQAAYICVGASPGFVLVIDGGAAQFDLYPGSRFQVVPPLDAIHGQAASTHSLRSDRQQLSVILRPRACPMLGATLPFAVDLALPEAADPELIQGCCTVMAQ